jgi:hypothetical protein
MGKKSAPHMRVMKTSAIGRTRRKGRRTLLTLELSPEAGDKLQRLRLSSLDQRGEMPDVSEVIERLIENAARNTPETPYPKT